jgi:hypothetical protein
MTLGSSLSPENRSAVERNSSVKGRFLDAGILDSNLHPLAARGSHLRSGMDQVFNIRILFLLPTFLDDKKGGSVQDFTE